MDCPGSPGSFVIYLPGGQICQETEDKTVGSPDQETKEKINQLYKMIFLWITLAYIAGFASALFCGLVYQFYKLYEHDRSDKSDN